MLRMLVTVLYIIVCIAMVVVVLMQEGKSGGLGALSGNVDTYWDKNKGRSVEGTLIKITGALAVLLIGLSVVLGTGWLD